MELASLPPHSHARPPFYICCLRGIVKQRTAVASGHIVRAKLREIGQQIR